MLKSLKIEQLILIEEATIPFGKGLNILTGETGSGKSVIMQAIELSLGARADAGLIRKGEEKGIVEAVFETQNPLVAACLKEGGIEHEEDEPIIIRREINLSGKSRIFINQQMVQLFFLRKLGALLLRAIGQKSSAQLLSLDYQRHTLDLFASCLPLLEKFQKKFSEENEIREKLSALKNQESARLREIDRLSYECEELQEAAIKTGEEEELFKEYTLLNRSDEIGAKLRDITEAFSGSKQSILFQLNRCEQILESLSAIDACFQESAKVVENSCLELQEVVHTLSIYQSRLHFDAERLAEVDQRLTLLNRLKKKYGPSLEEVLAYEKEAKEKLKNLENAESVIESLELELESLASQTSAAATALTSARQKSAIFLEKALTEHIRHLNMTHAEFFVDIQPQKRTLEGDDRIEFFLLPNRGEHKVAIKDSASGGEVSRILFALQAALIGKETIDTLIFDEIDANVGGQTATLIGKQLRKIAENCQVFCITHFPQVAAQADHHLQIFKKENAGRTTTQIKILEASERNVELLRMAGS